MRRYNIIIYESKRDRDRDVHVKITKKLTSHRTFSRFIVVCWESVVLYDFQRLMMIRRKNASIRHTMNVYTWSSVCSHGVKITKRRWREFPVIWMYICIYRYIGTVVWTKCVIYIYIYTLYFSLSKEHLAVLIRNVLYCLEDSLK